MSDFETVLLCFLIPVMYVLTYIAGRCDFLSVICAMIEDKAKQFAKDLEDEDSSGNG